MYVAPVRTTGLSNTSGKRRASGASGFAVHMGGGQAASAAGGTGSATQVLAMDALMALQSVHGQGGGKRQQIDRSGALLDELERLKADFLAGRVDASRLTRISELVSRHATVDDPELAELIAQIDLRAQVEMAKLGH